jgi:chromosome segregation ATPase
MQPAMGAAGHAQQRAVEDLSTAVEYERSRASALLSSLQDAKAHILALELQLNSQQQGSHAQSAQLEQRVVQLESELGQQRQQCEHLQHLLEQQSSSAVASKHAAAVLGRFPSASALESRQQQGPSEGASEGAANSDLGHHVGHTRSLSDLAPSELALGELERLQTQVGA